MRPEDILADQQNYINQGGLQLRKGTVAAFMANMRILLDDTAKSEHAVAKEHLLELLPALEALKFFELFDIKDEKIRKIIAG